MISEVRQCKFIAPEIAALLASHSLHDQTMGGLSEYKGFVLHFTAGIGEQLAFQYPGKSPFRPLFDLMKRQVSVECNAYTVNVLICKGGCSTTDWHQDKTLQLWKDARQNAKLTPQYVTIAYLQVPSTGGALEIRQENGIRVMQPQQGDMIMFPGDVWHRVQPFDSGLRISFVTEHYAVSIDSLDAMLNVNKTGLII